MRVLVAMVCSVVLLAGCVFVNDETYEYWGEKIPYCPDSGLSAYEVEVYERQDHNATRVFLDHGWHNVSIRHEGAGGFGSPDKIRYMMAHCNLEERGYGR